MPMTPPSDPKAVAPFEIVLTKGDDGLWHASIRHPSGNIHASRITGEEAERAAKASALRALANLCTVGVTLPREVEALFSRRLA